MGWFTQQHRLEAAGHLRVAQITDCHLRSDDLGYEGIDSTDSLVQVLQHMATEQFDCVFITGDISQDHTDASYQLLAQLCRQYLPDTFVARLPGNHDEPECLDKWMSEPPFVPVNHFYWHDWHILQLNSKGPTPAGWISEQHFAELGDILAGVASNHHVAVFTHHHPLPMGAYIDKHILQNGEQLMRVLGGFAQVKFVAHGHVHQEAQGQYATQSGHHIHMYATPSTSMQFAARSLKRANDEALGPGYRIFELFSGGGVSSEVVWLNRNK